MKPRLLDLFCGAGGCAKGYQRAGFYVVGVDISPQPRYCGEEFIQTDALEVLDRLAVTGNDHGDERVGVAPLDRLGGGDGLLGRVEGFSGPAIDGDGVVEAHGSSLVAHPDDCALPAPLVKGFDAIHASPPCQGYSKALSHMSGPQPMLIDTTRELLERTGLPWVMENVIGAPLPEQADLMGAYGTMVCGTGLGLRVCWHRLFEANFPLGAPSCNPTVRILNPHNQVGRDRIYEEFGRGDPEKVWRRERDTDWMGRYEAREAIPPAYTEHIGTYLLAEVNRRARVAA